jgi:haloacetate dehalogenase
MAKSRFLSGFETQTVHANGIVINVATAGSGPAVLLLHGHPQTHVVWRHVAPRLVRAGFTVVAPDLRGYGDSEKPASDPNHLSYSKRVMAEDQVTLMRNLGFETFSVVGHDRGGRVAHRLSLDHPSCVERIAVLDIAPTATMYALTDKEFATRYFWWFFLIQPFDFPERLIGSDPEYFMRRHIAGQVKVKGSVSEEILQEYLRSYQNPETLHAICEDYRASATIDLKHDEQDAAIKIQAPLIAIWGDQSVVGNLYDVQATWQEKANNVEGQALPCGHAIPEERPEALTALLLDFFKR